MKILQTIFCLLLFSNINLSQNGIIQKYFNTVLDDAEIFFVDGFSFYSYPFQMSEAEWLGTAGIGFGTYMLMQNDDNLRNKFGSKVDQYNSKFWKSIRTYGVVQYAEAAGTIIYIYGLFADDNSTRSLGRMVIQSLTYSGLSAMFIRMITGRKRPPFTDNPINFLGFTTDNDYQSFPSGHTTVAFAFSTILAEYFDSPWSRIGFYSLAGLSAAERLINSQHWFSDVAIGASLGILSALHVLNSESKRKNNYNSKLSIFPTVNGIALQYKLN